MIHLNRFRMLQNCTTVNTNVEIFFSISARNLFSIGNYTFSLLLLHYKQPSIFESLYWFFLFWIFHVKWAIALIQLVSSSACCFSLSLFSRIICVVTCISIWFIFLTNIPLCGCVMTFQSVHCGLVSLFSC